MHLIASTRSPDGAETGVAGDNTMASLYGVIGAPTPAPGDIALEDWDDLFRAVQDRLKLTVGVQLEDAAAAAPLAPLSAEHVQANVLECVAALEQLHRTISHDTERRRQLELDIADALAVLPRVQASAAGVLDPI